MQWGADSWLEKGLRINMPLTIPMELTNQFTITFLFVFAIVFGVIDLSKIFRGNRIVVAIISLAIAAFAAGYAPFTVLLWSYLPSISWFFIIMFLIAFVLRVLGVRKGTDPTESMIVSAAILFILLAAGWMFLQEVPVQIPYIGSGDNLIFLIGLILIIAIFWAAMKAGPSEAVLAEMSKRAKGG